jgi:hypothetical protein
MKKFFFTIIILLLTCGSAQAAARDTYYTSGYVMGLNLGQGTSEAPDITGYDLENTGFAARPYLDYELNRYVSFEVGYLFLPTANYTGSQLPSIKIKTSGFDLLLGAKYPLGEGFAIYGKLGGAIINARYTIDNGDSLNEDATVLAYSGGVDYSFANVGGLHWVIDYYHLDDKNTSSFKIPAQHIYSTGIYYLF